MNKIDLPIIGKLDIRSSEVFHEKEILVGSETIRFILHFDKKEISKNDLKPAIFFLENLNEIIKNIKEGLQLDYMDNGQTRAYIDWHLKEFSKEELEAFNEKKGLEISIENYLFTKILLIQIQLSFSNDPNQAFVVLDYSLGKDITDHLNVVYLNKKLKCIGISMES